MYSQMFQQWIQDIRRFFGSKSILSRLILINLAIWIIFFIVKQILWLFQAQELSAELVRFFAVPADPEILLKRPWTLFSYMFLHERFWHIFFNMYMLYIGGRIFLQHLTERHLLKIYFIGGLAGALVYVLSFNIFPVFRDAIPSSAALGASASVLAILIAIATYRPNYTIYLAFFGPVKMKHIAIVFVLLDLLSISGSNSGGHLAHLGGAMAGFLYIVFSFKTSVGPAKIRIPKVKVPDFLKKKNKSKFKDVNRNKRPLSDEEYNIRKAKQQKEIDKILEKISRSGYDSLSSKEKELLFRQSKH